MNRKRRKNQLVLCATSLLAAFLFLGCSTLSGSTADGKNTGFRLTSDDTPAPAYFDFGDVLIPQELEIDEDGTYIIESAGFLTGILALKGRVEKNSLVDFFKNNMAKDNWKMLTSFKSPDRALLLFQKQQRWCVINVTEKEFKTYVEIGVVPSTNAMESTGLLK
jgi:hypothetical protein